MVVVVEFGLVAMNALIQFLNCLVTELSFIYLMEKTDYLLDYLDYLDAAVYLSELRASEEYRKLQ